jgi:hypothetical protein
MKGASIFLVEDEALIRMMIVEMLEELGHRVVAEAGSICRTVGPHLRIRFGGFRHQCRWLQYQSHRGDRCGAKSAVPIRQRLWAGWQASLVC